MTEERNLTVVEDVEGRGPGEDQEQPSRVYIGFHQLGGIRLSADDLRLSPQEAMVLAGQLQAHATIIIHTDYMQQAMAAQQVGANPQGLIIPGK